VNDVIDGVREAFLDEGMDDLVLQELKQVRKFNTYVEFCGPVPCILHIVMLICLLFLNI
jgi:hypothetical protein